MHTEIFMASWQQAWAGIGIGIGIGRVEPGLLECVLARYSEAHRGYHTEQHLAECLEALQPVRHLGVNPAEIELGLWFHDAVYDPHRNDNELQSAAWALDAALRAGVAPEAAGRIEALIMATCHTAVPALPDEQLLVDIDLSILGAHSARFAEYEAQIRVEYAFVPEAVFRSKRCEILKGFVQRPRIYSTAHFFDRLEQRARANLQSSIDSIDRNLG